MHQPVGWSRPAARTESECKPRRPGEQPKTMSEIERRKAANEAVFRNVNERIENLQHTFAVAEREPLQMICECDRLDCMERIAVSVQAYELIRSHPDQFIVAPGHE